jgi:hypothetical protein
MEKGSVEGPFFYWGPPHIPILPYRIRNRPLTLTRGMPALWRNGA